MRYFVLDPSDLKNATAPAFERRQDPVEKAVEAVRAACRFLRPSLSGPLTEEELSIREDEIVADFRNPSNHVFGEFNISTYLNNFWLHLPHNADNRVSWKRNFFLPQWEQTFGDKSAGSTYHSEKFLNSTPSEFYALMDHLLDLCGIENNLLFTLMRINGHENLHVLCLPVYVGMRLYGYSHMDLIG